MDRRIDAEKSKLSPEDYVASIDEGFGEAKLFGTNHRNRTALPELIRRLRIRQLDVVVRGIDRCVHIERENQLVDCATRISEVRAKLRVSTACTVYGVQKFVSTLLGSWRNVLLTTHLAEL